jgi:hypothetical protein
MLKLILISKINRWIIIQDNRGAILLAGYDTGGFWASIGLWLDEKLTFGNVQAKGSSGFWRRETPNKKITGRVGEVPGQSVKGENGI